MPVNLARHTFPPLALAAACLLAAAPDASAQWTSSPRQIAFLAKGAERPTDVTATPDRRGGAFVFWQDDKSGTPDVYFQHINIDGTTSFRADGKRISLLEGAKSGPVADRSLANTAVVAWIDYAKDERGRLTAQRVKNDGLRFWSKFGVPISNGERTLVDYAMACDRLGSTHFVFVERVVGADETRHLVRAQRATLTGYVEYAAEGALLGESSYEIPQCAVVPDERGGSVALWIERHNAGDRLFALAVDENGEPRADGPKETLSHADKMINFRVLRVGPDRYYVVVETLGKEYNIYHQKFDAAGTVYWDSDRRLAVSSKGNNRSPDALVTADGSIGLTWTNVFQGNQEVYVQRYSPDGVSLWDGLGVRVASFEGNQFLQQIADDGLGGAIVAWFERGGERGAPSISTQRVDSAGAFLWDEGGIPIATTDSATFDQLTLIPDYRGGVVAVYRLEKNGSIDVAGQRVFGNKTFSGQIFDFYADPKGATVEVRWKATNEIDVVGYRLELFENAGDGEEEWREIEYAPVNEGIKNEYRLVHAPDHEGTLYYRLTQYGANEEILQTQIAKTNYYNKSKDDLFVAQNMPNPFSDSTAIAFHLPEPVEVTLEYFDSRFEKIDEQVFPEAAAGDHEATFRAEDLPAGVYFYRFTADEFVEVKKMVILR